MALFVYFENETLAFLTFVLCNLENLLKEIARMKLLGRHENIANRVYICIENSILLPFALAI